MNVCWKAVFGDWNSLDSTSNDVIRFFFAVIYDEFSQADIMESHSVSQFHSLFIEKGHDNYNQHFANKKTTAHRLLFSFHVLEQSGSPNQKKMVVLSTSTSSGHLELIECTVIQRYEFLL